MVINSRRKIGFRKEIDFGSMQTKTKATCFGELILPLVIVMNSLGVVLMLYSGTGISAISSMTYALNQVMPEVSLGTWTYIFQGALVCSLMIMRKKFVPQYLLSFVVGFGFGMMVDVHKYWMQFLPMTAPFRMFYFAASYCILCTGIALSNRCKMPIIPTDLFPKEMAEITGIKFSRIKMSLDLSCVVMTVVLTVNFFGVVKGLGIGTILSAFMMGKGISVVGEWIDKRVEFVTIPSVYGHNGHRHGHGGRLRLA